MIKVLVNEAFGKIMTSIKIISAIRTPQAYEIGSQATKTLEQFCLKSLWRLFVLGRLA